MEAGKVLSIAHSKYLAYLFVAVSLLLVTGCVSIVRIDGPYRGRVIDENTNQPIEGAVVHGSWYKAHIGAGGASHTFHDSYETLTDKNGEFRIPFQAVRIFTTIEEMNLTIFKVGFEQVPNSPWSGFKEPFFKDMVTSNGDHLTFKLNKLSRKERKDRFVDIPVLEPDNKQLLLRKETNMESKELGPK